MVAINVNDSELNCTGMILSGTKTVETRTRPTLDAFIGERVGLVRTGKGQATLVGYVRISERVDYSCPEEFTKDYRRHRIPNDSKLFCDGKKIGYLISEVEKLDQPQILTGWHPVPEFKGHKLNRFTARYI